MPAHGAHRQKTSVFLAALLVATAAGAYGIGRALDRNPPGYCSAQGRFIPDKEFIYAAIAIYEWEATRRGIHYFHTQLRETRKDPSDNDGYRAWATMRTRQDCCSAGRDTSVLNRVLQQQVVEVQLYSRPGMPGDAFLPFAFDICGKLLVHEWGYHFPANILRGRELTIANVSEVLASLR
ncbi:hypothetical protein [Azotobacter salinestris]|uniref:hypothetical protein n=1 Tax=Azotobacter salinestris TaxID=69964 RepID=UPI0032DF071D